MSNQPQIARLTLQIQRDLVAQANLKLLLAATNDTIAKRREELRKLKAPTTRVIAKARARQRRPRVGPTK